MRCGYAAADAALSLRSPSSRDAAGISPLSIQRVMAAALKDVDVYVTVPLTGPSISYTNLCGQPTVITRAGQTKDGLPISIKFTGNLYREDAALRLAYAYEQATPWHRHWPDVTRLPETPPKMTKANG